MLVKRDSDLENKEMRDLINSDADLLRQSELFQEEMRFKQILIEARRNKSMTQKQISEHSGLSQQAVSRLEKGQGGTIDTVIKYLHSMGLTLSIKEIV